MDLEKTALVVEGGAMRGIFATGVLDYFLERSFNPFNLYIGVSAGALNIAAYLAKMHGRNYHIFKHYTAHKECISVKKFMKGGHFLDLDWLWEQTIKNYRLDLTEIFRDYPEFLIGITNCNTGIATYIRPTEDNLEDYLKASSAMPFVYKKHLTFDGVRYVDGGLAEPIPVIEAYNRGATRIVVIRSKPPEYVMKSSSKISHMLLHKLPNLQKALRERRQRYDRAMDFIENPPEGVRVYDIAPTSDFYVSRFTKDPQLLDEGYEIGREEGRRFLGRLDNKKGCP